MTPLHDDIRGHAQAALALLGGLRREESAETRKQLAHVIEHLVTMRDELIAAGRAGRSVRPWLTRVNGIISALFGAEFPIKGLNKKRVDQSEHAIRELMSDLEVGIQTTPERI